LATFFLHNLRSAAVASGNLGNEGEAETGPGFILTGAEAVEGLEDVLPFGPEDAFAMIRDAQGYFVTFGLNFYFNRRFAVAAGIVEQVAD